MANQKIHLKGGFRLVEAFCAASKVQPGMLVEMTASTTVNGVVTVGTVQPHSTAGGFAERLFAQEDALQGRTVADDYLPGGSVGGTTDNGTNVGDPVQIAAEVPGNVGLGLLKAGYNYTVGLKLISAGDGTLKPTTGTPSQIIAVVGPNGAVDLSASSAVNTLSEVRYL